MALSVALGIASVLAVSVVQRTREIGILRAMGASRQQMLRVFLLQGAMFGLVGSLLGQPGQLWPGGRSSTTFRPRAVLHPARPLAGSCWPLAWPRPPALWAAAIPARAGGHVRPGVGHPPCLSTSGDQEVLRLDGLCKRYNLGQPTETQVLHGLSLRLQRSDFTALTGSSGSGKSTLLNLIGLLDTPTAGELHLLGQPTSGMDEAQRTALRGQHIGFVFQFHHLITAFTALEMC